MTRQSNWTKAIMAAVGAGFAPGASSVFAWQCAFECAVDSGSREKLAADLDATLLTLDGAGGSMGATVGPFARENQNVNRSITFSSHII